MSQSTEVQRFPISPAVIEEAKRLGDRRTDRLRGLDLRVLMKDGEPWFVARDACAALLLVNVSDAVGRLDDDERKTDKLSLVTGDPSDELRKVNLINEPGLYSLIMTSRVPAARAFKRWVTHDVLPAIRKTGAYSVPKSRVDLARELLAAEERAEEAEKAATEQRELLVRAHGMLKAVEPKVEAFDELMSADGSVSLAQAAQLVGIGRQTLIDKLAQWGALIVRPGHSDHLRPYQAHVRAGRFVCIAQAVPITHGDGTAETLAKSVTRVTAKGVEWIRQQQKTSGPKSLIRRTS